MLKKICTLPISKLWLLLASFHLFLLSIALYYQYVENAQPCVLCVYIRLIFVCLFCFCLAHALTLKFTHLQWVLGAVHIAVIGWGISLSYELHLLQTDPSPFATCSFFPNFWIPLETYAPWMFKPLGSCTDDSVMLLGLSMASWCMLFLSFYIAAFVAVFYQGHKARRK